MNKETYLALKIVVGIARDYIEENPTIGNNLLSIPIEDVESWIDEVAKEYTDQLLTLPLILIAKALGIGGKDEELIKSS